MHRVLETIEQDLRPIVEGLYDGTLTPDLAERAASDVVREELHEGCPDGEFRVRVRVAKVLGEWTVHPEVSAANRQGLSFLEDELGLENSYDPDLHPWAHHPEH